MNTPINVLFIEDNPGDARLVEEELRSTGSRTVIHLEWEDRLEKGLQRLGSNHVQAILLDLNLPDSEGLDSLRRVLSCAPEIPVIVMTGHADEQAGMQAMQAGAQDYLIKGQADGRVLIRSIQYAIQRKQSEMQLADALQFTERILTSSPVGILTYKLTGECVSANAYVAQMVGATIEQLRNQNFHHIESWKKSGLYELAQKAMASKQLIADDVHVVTSFGKNLWLRAQFVTFQSGGEELLLLTFGDITERKHVEQALRESEERFQNIIRHSSSMFYTHTPDHVLVYVSPQSREILDCAPEEAMVHWQEFLSDYPSNRQGIESTERAIQTGQRQAPYELELLTRKGQKIWVQVDESPVVRDGKTAAIVGSVTDITDRKRAEAALRESEESYRQLFEAESDAIFLIENENGRILQANNAACDLYGYSRDELLRMRNTDLSGEPEQTRQVTVKTPVIIDQVVTIPLRFHRKRDGTVFPVEITGRFFVHQGRPVHIAAIRDITERQQGQAALQAKTEEVKVMSQQLWHAAKLATMGELAASIAHELNNPLATVSLRTEMLLQQLPPDDLKIKPLWIIQSEVKRMSRLVNNLLQFSRRSSLQISTVNIREEIANTLELVQHHLDNQKIRTVQELSAETPLIQVDRQQIRQVLLNLLTNAADAMSQGGTLTIRTWPGPKQRPGTTAPLHLQPSTALGLPVSDLPHVMVEVSDTGEGIPPEKLGQVWERFYTTKSEGKGTGLGLAICRRIVQEHGGMIEISSHGVPGQGTTVLITLPAVQGRE